MGSLLELGDANPYTARAYRRAAETIRGAAFRWPSSCGQAAPGTLRGIGPGIEARLRELVETGEIAELSVLERELAPDLVGLGRYLGLAPSARSSWHGRSASAPPTSSARPRPPGDCRACRASDPRPRRGCSRHSPVRPSRERLGRGLLLNRARELVDGIAAALGGEAAGDCAAGATPASCWRSSAPPRIPRRCWHGSPRYPRSSRSSSRASGARSASPSRVSRWS